MDSYFSRVLLIPSVVFLAAMFGGAYGSGREVMQFISQHGPVGGFIAITTIFLALGLVLFMCFELARLFGAYEYRSFCKRLLGRYWLAYEVLIMVGLIVSLAICASSSGAVLESHFGMPALVGGILLLLIVVGLTYQGRTIVEKSMIYAVSALAILIVWLLVEVMSLHGSTITASFEAHPVVYDGIQSGLQYALATGGYIPVILYCCRGIQSRGEAITAGAFAAFITVIPAIIFHLCFMMGFPEIGEQRLPTYWVIEETMPDWYLQVYVVVLFVMIAQTGVGLLQGFVERIDGWYVEKHGAPLSKAGHAGVSALALVASTSLASIGLVELIIRAYDFLAVSFVLVFFIPLLTVGSRHIYRAISAPAT